MTNHAKTTLILLAAVFLIFGFCSTGIAAPKMKAGLGAAFVPDYVGSEDGEAVPLVMFNARWEEGQYINFLGNQLRANLLPSSEFQVGPLLRYRQARDDVDNETIEKMDDIDAAVELGAFLVYTVNDISFGASFSTDVSDVHWGTVITLDLSYRWKANVNLTLRPKIYTSYASENFNETYFGVSEKDNIRSGLPLYSPDGGFNDYGVLFVGDYKFNDTWGVMAGVGASKLIGDAKDSPLVDDLGDDTQFLAGVMATYSF